LVLKRLSVEKSPNLGRTQRVDDPTGLEAVKVAQRPSVLDQEPATPATLSTFMLRRTRCVSALSLSGAAGLEQASTVGVCAPLGRCGCSCTHTLYLFCERLFVQDSCAQSVTDENVQMLLSAAIDGWGGTSFIDTTPSCFTRPSVIHNARLLLHTHTHTHTQSCCMFHTFPPSRHDLHRRSIHSETSGRPQ